MKNAFSNTFIALKNRNFLIYWIGLSISQSGTWMQNIAQPWLALMITNSPTLVGLTAAAQFVPIMLFSLFSGVIVDKMDKKRILYFTQGGQCVVSVLFAFSVFFDFASYALVLSLALLTGIFNCLDSPTRHSFIPELIGERKLVANAIALNSMSVSVSRIIGPSLAGLIMASFGIGACFLANSISFIAIFVSLLFIRTQKSKAGSNKESMLKAIKSALGYIKSHDILLTPLLILLIFATLVPNYSVSISALVKESLGGVDKDFGYLMGMLGVGALLGAFVSASQRKQSLKTMYYAPFVCAFCLAMVGVVADFWWVGLWLVLTAFSFIMSLNAINACLQTHSLSFYRGRVMSVYSLFFLGSTPIGAMIAGLSASYFGAQMALFICAGLTWVLLILLFVIKYAFLHHK